MDSNKRPFDIEFTEQYIEELTEVYEYITNNLKENGVAKRLLTELNNKILNLSYNPELYMKIGKVNRLKRDYHRIILKNFIVLYTVDKNNKKVYLSRIIYGKRNY